MAVKAWTSPPLGFMSDSELQTWLTDLFDNLTGTGGLVQTADTGQLDHTTVVVPAATPSQVTEYVLGYWIFRFDDALQSTDPIFIKLEITYNGSTAVQDRKTMGSYVKVGTGSNGTGTLTGAVSNTLTISHARGNDDASPASITGSCKIVYNEDRGFFGIAYGRAAHRGYQGAYNHNRCIVNFFISRKQAANGDAIGGGFCLVATDQKYGRNYPSDGNFINVSWLRTQTITTEKNPTNDADLWSSFPFMYVPKSVGDEVQCMRHYHLPYQDKPTTNYNMVAVYFDTIGSNQEFELVSGGTEPSNFICLGREYALRPYDGRHWTLAILWE